MHHPMLKITLAFAGGICLNNLLPLPIGLWMVCFLGTGLCFIQMKRSRPCWLIAMLITSGACLHAMHTRPVHPADVRHLDLGEGWYVTVEGVLTETPSQKTSRINGQETHSNLATVHLNQLAHATDLIPATGQIRVRTSGMLPASFYKGIPVRITGVLTTPARPIADGLFDYRTYLEQQGIHHILYADSPNAWTIQMTEPDLPKRPWTDQFRIWAMNALSHGLPEMDEATQLRGAMVLGLKSWLNEDMIEPFRWSGSMHLFAISGLHVAMVTGLLLAGMQWVIRSRWHAGTWTLVAMWCYVAITGWQTSAIRAGIMTSVMLSGWILKKPHTLLNSLFTAAWFVLIWQPTQLFQIGFQLSFGVVLGLATTSEPIRQFLSKRLESDPWILKERLSAPQRCRNWCARKLAAALSVSLAAWIGSLPIIWQQFHLVTPVGLAGNILMVPLAGATITCAMGSLACATWAPWLTELFNHSGWFWMECMMRMGQWMSSLPLSHFHVSPLPASVLWYYYAFLVLIAMGCQKHIWRKRAVYGCGALTLLLVLTHIELSWRKQEISLLPIEDGDAIWMNQAGELHDSLIDGGSRRTVLRTLIPFLESRGVNRLNDLWISHGDADHIGGYEDLIHRYPPQRIVSYKDGYRSPYYKSLLATAETNGWKMELIGEGISIGQMKILHPPIGSGFRRADDTNLVGLVQWGDCQILFAGDLSRDGVIALSNRHPNLHADILVINRPKEDISPNYYWMDSLGPQLILVTGIAPDRRDRWIDQLKKHPFQSNPIIWDTGTRKMIRLESAKGVVRVIPTEGEPVVIGPAATAPGGERSRDYGLLGSTISNL
ncbi:MAG: ComEC/Rec2 family competence protein [Verrucomicrobiota bacterium]